MIRIKLPFGKVTASNSCELQKFLMSIQQDVCTLPRQDIQIHYVSLDRTPQLWAELEKTMLPKRSLWKQFEILPQAKQEIRGTF
jgi:sulfite reductase beta subunit-like hemoprotein